MKYFSTFSGIGGFEYGICNAYRSKNRGIEEDQTRDKGQRLFTSKGKDARTTQGPTSECATDIAHERPLCVGYSEIDKYAVQIYQKHYPEHKNYGDITKINTNDFPEFELLVGGFPCQTFSIAGKRSGFNDTRGTLFFDLARILGAKRPKLFVFENVKGLLSHDNGRTFEIIISTLDELGYDLQWQVLNSKNHGVPQNRERVFIVGHLRGTPRPQVFPFGENNQDTQDTLQKERQVFSTLRAKQGGPDCEDSYNIAGNIRRLTPLECERLQGFPDGWTNGISDTQRYKCLGNAVTTNVIRDIFMQII